MKSFLLVGSTPRVAGSTRGGPLEGLAGTAIRPFHAGLTGAMMAGPVLTVTIGETAGRLRAEPPRGTPGLGSATEDQTEIEGIRHFLA